MREHRRRVLARVSRTEDDQLLLHRLYWWMSCPREVEELRRRVDEEQELAEMLRRIDEGTPIPHPVSI